MSEEVKCGCKGTGYISETSVCPSCGGDGKVGGKKQCKTCHGRKVIKSKVRVPCADCEQRREEGFSAAMAFHSEHLEQEDFALKRKVACPRGKGGEECLSTCLARFMNVVAFARKEDKCYKCPIGAANRKDFADVGALHKGLVLSRE